MLTRRQLLQKGAIGIAAIAGGLFLKGCGGGSTTNSMPATASIIARTQGSVHDNSQPLGLATHYSDTVGDEIVTRVGNLEGNLVFEVNGARRDSGSDSAPNTQVSPGDVITWKKL